MRPIKNRKLKKMAQKLKCYIDDGELETHFWFSEKNTEGPNDAVIFETVNGQKFMISIRPKDGKVVCIGFY